MTTVEVAAAMHKSPSTIWRWVHTGKFPQHSIKKFGRVVKLRRDVLINEGFIDQSQTATPAAQEGACDVG